LGRNFNTVKIDASGAPVWSSIFDGPEHLGEISTVSRVDASGQTYVAGLTGTAGQQWRWITVKLGSNGATAWSTLFGEATSNKNFQPRILELDAQDRLTVAGTGPGESGPGQDVLLVTYLQHKSSIGPGTGGGLRLEFVRAPGSAHRLKSTVRFDGWTDVADLVADEDGRVSHEVPASSPDGLGFYRLVPR
jgi:hypothetical protein